MGPDDTEVAEESAGRSDGTGADGEPSDDEENTEQRFRRKERIPAPTFSGRGRGGSRQRLSPSNNTNIQLIGNLDGDVAHNSQPPVGANLTGNGEPMVGVAIRVGLGRGRQSTVRSDSSERGSPSP